MVYLLGGGVFLWVILRRILFKMWWCVAVLAFAMPAGAANYTGAVKIYIGHGDEYDGGEFWHSEHRNQSIQVVPVTAGVGYFYLAHDPTSSTPTYLRHSVVVSKVGGEYVRVDIWGPLIHLTTYRTVADHYNISHTGSWIGYGDTRGWVATSDPNDGYPDGEDLVNEKVGTSRAPDGEQEEFGDVDFLDPNAQYWLYKLQVTHTAWMSLPVKDDDDIADPTSSYFPDPNPGLSASDAVTAIEEAFENVDDFDPTGYESASDSMLHEDLLPTISLPANAAALKVVLNTGFSDITGSSTWLYNEETSDIDVSTQLSTLLGSGATPPVPYLFNQAVDLLEDSHDTFLPVFQALSVIFTILFTFTIVFMIFRLFLWSIDIQRPFS